jgi:hypothetical protein
VVFYDDNLYRCILGQSCINRIPSAKILEESVYITMEL